MRTISFIALAAALHVPPVFACSVDELKKVAEDQLDRLPSSMVHEPEARNGESNASAMWQMFEGQSGTPHSFVFTYFGHIGQTKVRLSFLNRRDFVIVETKIGYAEPVTAENRSGKFKVEAPQFYFFCDGRLKLPPGTPDAAEITEKTNAWRKELTEGAGLLKQEFARIPE